jgi:hypothetical protein
VWDDKEDTTMIDEVLEGNGHAQKLNANLHDMAHSFVLQNIELMASWCL